MHPEARARRTSGPGPESSVSQAFPWLLVQKITVPDRVAGYVHRAELVDRAMPTRRRLTVLKASGGFGKTTLLAECCRKLRREGVAVAWVSLDERDEPAVLDTYITVACQSAGFGSSGHIGIRWVWLRNGASNRGGGARDPGFPSSPTATTWRTWRSTAPLGRKKRCGVRRARVRNLPRLAGLAAAARRCGPLRIGTTVSADEALRLMERQVGAGPTTTAGAVRMT